MYQLQQNIWSLQTFREVITSDGTGVITLAYKYIPDLYDVYLRGVLVQKADITETGALELTLTPATEIGDIITVNYNPLN